MLLAGYESRSAFDWAGVFRPGDGVGCRARLAGSLPDSTRRRGSAGRLMERNEPHALFEIAVSARRNPRPALAARSFYGRPRYARPAR